MRLVAGAAALGALTVFAACARAESSPPAAEVVDSAGIRIVLNAPEAGDTIALGAAPLFRIGDGSADSTLLFEVRAGVLGPNGFVLADGGTRELLWFDANGVLRRRTGGQGNGPGEFRFLSVVHPRDDGGLHIVDGANRRVTALDGAGELLWMRRFDPPAEEKPDPGAWTAAPVALAVLPDGRILGVGSSFGIPDGVAGPLPWTAALRTYDTTSAVIAELGRLTVSVQWENPDAMPPFGPYVEGPMFESGSRGARLAYSTEGTSRIDVLDDGARTLSIRERRSRHVFVPDSIPEGGGAADSLPAYREVRVDALGRVWAEVADPDERGPDAWRLFAPDGSALGTLLLPADATLLDADATRALLRRRDALDVETVELWTIAPSANSESR